MKQEWQIFQYVLTDIFSTYTFRNLNESYNIKETFTTELEAINYVTQQGWKGAYYFVKKIYFE